MHLLDDGDAAGWAATFTEDGTFEPPPPGRVISGRRNIADGAAKAAAERAEKGEQHRHWHGMLTVRPAEDGTVWVRCYALIIVTPAGGPSRLNQACVCEDVLVRGDSGWRVRYRRVTRDG
ncbi:nuclear transport factor 2 family protein [Amycolatopsis acidicola]|uniref:Nuclear transport factor 2 family protein n=2 Tax=Amycolatopsis acidicola TaxID=2596893 RepID=A0A5N0VJS5_9PSEU|nr:nuclear transport factor 2 family protein [Amycolatopsis acidicola]